MATATSTATITHNPDNSQRLERITGTIAIQASPAVYVTGGLALTFAGFDQLKAGGVPILVMIQSAKAAASPNTAAYIYQYAPGTTIANGKLQIFVQDAVAGNPLAEMANNTAIPAGVSGDTIAFTALFTRL